MPIFTAFTYKILCYDRYTKKISLEDVYSKLEAIENQLSQLDLRQHDHWVDGFYVMKRLGISKRTLQTYRTDGLLSYSQVRGIHFYKEKDIDDMLQRHYYKFRK